MNATIATKIIIAGIGVAAVAGCGVVGTAEPTPTPTPTVTVTESAEPTYRSDYDYEEDMSVGEIALTLAWADLDEEGQDSVCKDYNRSPSYAWSIAQDAEMDDYVTRLEFEDFFDSVC